MTTNVKNEQKINEDVKKCENIGRKSFEKFSEQNSSIWNLKFEEDPYCKHDATFQINDTKWWVEIKARKFNNTTFQTDYLSLDKYEYLKYIWKQNPSNKVMLIYFFENDKTRYYVLNDFFDDVTNSFNLSLVTLG